MVAQLINEHGSDVPTKWKGEGITGVFVDHETWEYKANFIDEGHATLFVLKYGLNKKNDLDDV
jgi:hypothetical protein